jgi:hypothetical protein
VKVNRNVLLLALICLSVLVFTPVAWAGQYQWHLSTDEQGNIHESIILQGMELETSLEGWNSKDVGEGSLSLERTHKDWYEYSAASNGLPLVVEKKNYLVVSSTTLNYQVGNGVGLFEELVSRADGDIIIQAGGIIQESSATKIDNLDQDPTATWHLVSEQAGDALEGTTFLQVLQFNGLVISLIILLFGFFGITIWYMTYIRRVNKLIAEEYSLDDIEKLLEKRESEKKEEKY